MPEQQEQVQEWREALPANGDVGTWTPQQKALIEAMGLVHTDRQGNKTLAPRPVVEGFLYTCRRTGLDPLARQVYCIARWDGASQSLKWTTQTSIDGFRVIAERHGRYAGQDDVEWLTEAGEWVDVFLPGRMGDHPLAARATVMRHDFLKPLRAVAEWSAYAQTKSGGGLVAMWDRMGPGQLAKCAEALALRKAFPQDLSGLYTSDEMGQADAQAAPEPLAVAQTASASPEAPQQAQAAPDAAAAPAAAGQVDEKVQTDWWDRLRVVTFLGVKGSGDGGLREQYLQAKQAGILSWPIGPGEEQTFQQWLMQQSARLPEQAPAAEPAPGAAVAEGAEDDEDTPMVLTVAKQPGARPAQVSEPQPPAPARGSIQPDEADQDVPPWANRPDEAPGWGPGEQDDHNGEA